MKPILCLILLLPFAFNLEAQAQWTYGEAKTRCDSIRDHNLALKSFPSVRSDCVVGALIPDFTAQTMDGREITSGDLKGKVTIINFWFMFCAPCVAELPGLNAIVATYGDRLNYLAINGSDDPPLVPDFLANNPFDFTHISDGGDLATEIFRMSWGYPTTFIVDQNGVIVKAFSGGKTDDRAIEEIQEKIVPVIDELLNSNQD